jgi:hypothetical protein
MNAWANLHLLGQPDTVLAHRISRAPCFASRCATTPARSGAPQAGGFKGVFDPPEHLFTSVLVFWCQLAVTYRLHHRSDPADPLSPRTPGSEAKFDVPLAAELTGGYVDDMVRARRGGCSG